MIFSFRCEKERLLSEIASLRSDDALYLKRITVSCSRNTNVRYRISIFIDNPEGGLTGVSTLYSNTPADVYSIIERYL